jgi:hypothetical protein
MLFEKVSFFSPFGRSFRRIEPSKKKRHGALEFLNSWDETGSRSAGREAESSLAARGLEMCIRQRQKKKEKNGI